MESDNSVRSARILVVDDDESIRLVIESVLSKNGHTVFTAENGSEGLKQAEKAKPDLILMDITMPDMDGYETTICLKQHPDLKDVPVLFMSGRSPSEDGGRSFAHGGLTYLKKPFHPQQLKDLVTLMLDSIPGR